MVIALLIAESAFFELLECNRRRGRPFSTTLSHRGERREERERKIDWDVAL